MGYHLVLENRPNDFMPIDISIISNDKSYGFKSIEEIDSFTKKYSKEDIMVMISDNNIVPYDYLSGTLRIINDNKYRYDVLYNTTTFSLDDFFASNITNKQIMNKFLNIYLKSNKANADNMKKAIKEQDLSKILDLVFKLPYLDVRNIYTYLVANI
ncbi:MAG: hypothetical protein IKR74_04335 [Bacilli bacterium]|nr:hypothetical protein [Bacilli bacterium]